MNTDQKNMGEEGQGTSCSSHVPQMQDSRTRFSLSAFSSTTHNSGSTLHSQHQPGAASHAQWVTGSSPRCHQLPPLPGTSSWQTRDDERSVLRHGEPMIGRADPRLRPEPATHFRLPASPEPNEPRALFGGGREKSQAHALLTHTEG